MVRVTLLPFFAVCARGRNKTWYARGFVRTTMNAADVPVATFTEEEIASVPHQLDWSQLGATTKVKDQGSCGSCWAHSAISGVESGVFMATGSLPQPLSVQQLVSCDTYDGGCYGGDMQTAFRYIKENDIDTDSHYPSEDNCGAGDFTTPCAQCKPYNHVVNITDYKYAVSPCRFGGCHFQNENGLKAALQKHGPLSVCVNAENWEDYTGGVYDKKCSGSRNAQDHCVQLVGYDDSHSIPYWKLRNSWSGTWGEQGHIRLKMGINACGVANDAMFVTAHAISEDVIV